MEAATPVSAEAIPAASPVMDRSAPGTRWVLPAAPSTAIPALLPSPNAATLAVRTCMTDFGAAASAPTASAITATDTLAATTGYGYGYPWGLGYYDPFLWDWSADDAAFDNDYNNNLATADEMNQQSLEQQQMMRQEEADGDQDIYARRSAPRSPSSAAASDPQPSPMMPPTVLVFRDQHQQEVQNYAIVGQTLWNFAPGRTQKIPLSDLDLAATEKANDDRGVTFRVPAASEAQ